MAAISRTSAGAINGAAFKAGMVEAGRDGAREQLDWVWKELGAHPDLDFPEWMTPFSLS